MSSSSAVQSASLESYIAWADQEAQIVAPKLSIVEYTSCHDGNNQHDGITRGLVANATIYPNEQIMHVPAKSLIDVHHLLEMDLVELAHDGSSCSLTDGNNNNNTDEEVNIIRFVREFSETAMSKSNSSSWRDDTIALFLIALRMKAERSEIISNDAAASTVDPDRDDDEDDSSSVRISTSNNARRMMAASTAITSTSAPSRIDDALPVVHADAVVVSCDDDGETYSYGGVLSATTAQVIDEAELQPVQAASTIVAHAVDSNHGLNYEGEFTPTTTTTTSSLPMDQQQQLNRPNTNAVRRFPSFLSHVAMLPRKFSTPLFFTEAELERMCGTNCHGYTVRIKQQMEQDWNRLKNGLRMYNDEVRERDGEIVLEHEDFSLDLYRWALSVIYTRSTDFQKQDENTGECVTTRVIVPFFDMINHSFESEIYHAMYENGGISVFNGPTKTLAPGTEITISYGDFPNEKLLFVYGFCVDDNPFDVVSIYAPISPHDPLYDAKASLLRECCRIDDTNQPYSLHRKNINKSLIPSKLLSALRMMGVQSGEDFLAVSKAVMDASTTKSSTSGENKEIPMLTRENEVSALSALYSAIHEMARMISLNMISDEGLWAASGDSAENSTAKDGESSSSATNQRHIKLLNKSEQRILVAALADIKTRIDNLELG